MSSVVQILSLRESDLQSVYDCFVLAFDEFVARTQPTLPDFRELLKRRRYAQEVSFGAFEGARLVGFALNAVDQRRGYACGVGVLPSHRGGGIARALMERSIETLLMTGAQTYALEVRDQNSPAIHLYESLGFSTARLLQTWSFAHEPAPLDFPELGQVDLAIVNAWCDSSPSWQNEPASIQQASDPYVVIGTEHAAAVLFPNTGEVPLLAVDRDFRREGLGRRLLQSAAAYARRSIRLVHIDAANIPLATFLKNCGAVEGVRQLEMVCHLQTRLAP